MTQVLGGPIGPDGLGDEYKNPLDDRRAQIWYGNGARQAVLEGFTWAQVAGQMKLDVAAGAALVSERDGSGNAQARGYLVRSIATTRVDFTAASASARNDALVACVVDVEDGAIGAGAAAAGVTVGAHLLVVPGVSGTTTPRSDNDINTYLGRGGWTRLSDVPIASTDTQINTANMVDWRSFSLGGVLSSSRRHVTATSYTTAVAAVVPYDTALLNEIPWDSTNKRFIAPSAGYYQITAGVHFVSNSTGYRTIRIMVNGSAHSTTQAAAASGGGSGPVISRMIKLAAGDLVSIEAMQGSGGALVLTTSSVHNFVDITRVG